MSTVTTSLANCLNQLLTESMELTEIYVKLKTRFNLFL